MKKNKMNETFLNESILNGNATDKIILKDVLNRANLKYKKEIIEVFEAAEWRGGRITGGHQNDFRYIIRRNDGIYFVFDKVSADSYFGADKILNFSELLKGYTGPKRFKIRTNEEHEAYSKTVYSKATKFGTYDGVYGSYANTKIKHLINFLEGRKTTETNTDADLDRQRLNIFKSHGATSFKRYELKQRTEKAYKNSSFTLYKLIAGANEIYATFQNKKIRPYEKAVRLPAEWPTKNKISRLNGIFCTRIFEENAMAAILDETFKTMDNFNELFEI